MRVSEELAYVREAIVRRLSRSRHFWPGLTTARADRFVHRDDVTDHRHEHQYDSDPKPPFMVNRAFRMRLMVVMTVFGVLLMRHANGKLGASCIVQK